MILPFVVAAIMLSVAPAKAQPIPGSEGWLKTPLPGRTAAPPRMTALDIDLVRCYRNAIATGQFFLGDVSFVLARCQRPFAAWVTACEQREGQGAPICLLGPEQAVGDSLRDAWAHRDNLFGLARVVAAIAENRRRSALMNGGNECRLRTISAVSGGGEPRTRKEFRSASASARSMRVRPMWDQLRCVTTATIRMLRTRARLTATTGLAGSRAASLSGRARGTTAASMGGPVSMAAATATAMASGRLRVADVDQKDFAAEITAEIFAEATSMAAPQFTDTVTSIRKAASTVAATFMAAAPTVVADSMVAVTAAGMAADAGKFRG